MDGENDIRMNQQANVGIGIEGKEGMQGELVNLNNKNVYYNFLYTLKISYKKKPLNS